jgi:hypothetical protein
MAAVACNTNLKGVSNDECLGASLPKINSNFTTLQNILWSLRERVDSRVEVRTFFYYGPNSAGPAGSKNGSLNPAKGVSQAAGTSPAASGMDDGKISRPSNLTIQAFINSSSQINLPSISSPGDIAYVIFQKTGFNSIIPSNLNTFKGSTRITTEQLATTISPLATTISPIFIIWKLTCSKLLSYLVDQGFPKFHRAQTLQQTSKSGVNVPQPLSWDQPQNWSLF